MMRLVVLLLAALILYFVNLVSWAQELVRNEPNGAAATPTAQSANAAFKSIPLGQSQWTSGFWFERMRVCEQQSLPALWEIMNGTKYSYFLENFRLAAGEKPGKHRGPSWNDGDCYKWLEAAAAVYAASRSPQLLEQMDAAIRIIAKAQREDGYLHTPVLIRNRQGDLSAQPFSEPLQFELYNLGHLMTAACVHYQATGSSELLHVAFKAADFLDRIFHEPTSPLGRSAICPAHYMGLVELGRTTGETRYVELAKLLIDRRDRVIDGTDDNQDRIPFRDQRQAMGHAVRANYLYAGVADLFLATGDRSWLPPLESIWQDVVSRKMYVTGACGALYDGASPDGSADQKHITRTHQAYGRAFQLPNGTAHNESCASVGNILWNWRMLQISGEARFAEVIEQTLFNGLLASISLDGTRFFYTNTLRQLNEMPADLRWSRQREPFINCFCCPPNVVRTIAQSINFAYGKSADGVWIHQYGASQLRTQISQLGELQLQQETNYPWDGRIKISILAAPQAEFTLRLRIPAWAKNATMLVNGISTEEAIPASSYSVIRRLWKAGDIVELNLPMQAQMLEAHPLVEEARNQVAIQCGPVVYCLESKDLPDGVRLLDASLPRSAVFSKVEDAAQFDKLAQIGQLTMLETECQIQAHREWDGKLYRALSDEPVRSARTRLIPYFAWGNRGKSEMSVWLPLAR